jgi:threonine dehydrogenase-like Zn-dependent dehydrogenase
LKGVFAERGVPVLKDLPPPAADGEALVRVGLAGICGTDLEILEGYLGFDGVLGHEFVGVVERAPDPAWVGRRVVGEINVACGGCDTCRAGRRSHCPDRTVLGIVGRNGAFAEYLSIPVANLHPVPDEVPDEVAVLTEPLAAAFEILEQVSPAPGARVLVLGDGRLGQVCARLLHASGFPPVVVGRHPGKLSLLEKRGLETRNSVEGLGRDFDFVVEATGDRSAMETALDLVRPRGTIVLKSTVHGRTQIDLAAVVIDEITVVGSRCGPFEPALALLARDPEFAGDIVSATYSLDDARVAFAHARRPDTLKVLLRP